MASSLKQKFKNIGPGALVAAGFVGPGTVTTCTVSGASYGYTMLWCLLFATVATIIFQEMASRIGIATQEGLGENIRDRISNPALKWIAIVIVIIAIFIGNTAYETGNITGGILGVVIGYLLAWALTLFAANSGILSELGASGGIAPSFSITTVLLAFAVSVGIGVIFGFYPARRAAKLDPVECLRYQ